MLVTKTELHFNDVEAPAGLSIPSKPGLGVAWIETARIVLDPSDLSGLDLFGEDSFPLARLSVGDIYLEGAPQVFAEIVNAALWNCPLDVAAQSPGMNGAIVETARNASVAIAPSSATPLIALLAPGGGRTAGTILGWGRDGQRLWLALVARPEGLLVIGSALALASASNEGLERSLGRLVEEKTASPRRR